ncbi:MFS transporter [Mucilaginibacter pallidiroseus]|uniref:MFS transporter n=1 Tax=Mucilaginibacter pallidiroseus TaxID=2599295 RepID=A0A563TYC5_9SPHI|nr:MFS transporter [Mucilaginibacter pallidiroseus]TWR24368.1 MFS transporter [Mucilaginibacter pallidiroseus]
MKTISLSSKEATASLFTNLGLGAGQILLWGGSYFILSVLSKPIMAETGWTYQMVYGALSFSLVISGLVVPFVGRMIQSLQHNHLFRYTGLVMAAGLLIMGSARNYPTYILAWAITGLAMGMGLYDALFASIGKYFGKSTRNMIVKVTLISSLAPTISWLITSYLLENLGWRDTCFVYAAILGLGILPLHFFVFPQVSPPAAENSKSKEADAAGPEPKLFLLLISSFTLGAVLTTGIIINLIDILTRKDNTMASSLMIISFLGPSQAGVRLLELIMPPATPLKMSVISALAMLAGLILLMVSNSLAIPGVILFGMGNGMRSVVRGTLPLSLFGESSYAVLIGKLGRWPLIAQAVTPVIAGFIMQKFNSMYFLGVFLIIALVNVLISVVIYGTVKKTHLSVPPLRQIQKTI